MFNDHLFDENAELGKLWSQPHWQTSEDSDAMVVFYISRNTKGRGKIELRK